MPELRPVFARSTASVLAAVAVGCFSTPSWCHGSEGDLRPALAGSDEEPRPPVFVDAAASVGLSFEHFLGSTGEYLFPEVTSAGAALFDFDGDGDLDVYLLQGAMLEPGKSVSESLFEPRVPLPPRNRLFRNELIAEVDGGTLRFTDVTESSGAGHVGYAQGVATGDIDNDGDVDLFVTNLGADVLLRNDGDGTFTDVSQSSGVADERWTTSASFLDFDRDGLLDLYVTAYAEYSAATDKDCQGTRARAFDRHDYCGPKSYAPIPDRLYRNSGDATFEDVTEATGIYREYGHGLGVAVADFDANGWLDVYVANDGNPNQLWMNERGKFENAGLVSGAAMNVSGEAEAGMGVAVDDLDDDGDFDIFVTHLIGETNTLYQNLGSGFFVDRTEALGIGVASRHLTGFGTVFADFDHDGQLDLFIANGAVSAEESQLSEPYPYRQPNQLMMRREDGFRDESGEAGPGLVFSEVSRGVACGDIDNDGDLDLLVTNCNGPVRLLRNELEEKRNWFIVRVVDESLARDALGATIRTTLSNGVTLSRMVRSDTSYCSARDARVHFAWSGSATVESISVSVPGRPVSDFDGVPLGQISILRVGAEADPTPSTPASKEPGK